MIKRICKKVRLLFANRNYKSKNQYLELQGAIIGQRTRLNCKVQAFGTEPYLVRVGTDCLFAEDVRFITHDGGISVLNTLNKFGNVRYDKIAPIEIGNNVYIGTGAYIMPGVKVGDNCIIGARALVTKDIPSDSVAVGIPAKVIESIDTYYENCVKKQQMYPTAQMRFEEKREYYRKIYLY